MDARGAPGASPGAFPRASPGVSPAAAPAHEIRRFESAVWSLYTLSDNPSLPVACRAACRLAADHAAAHLSPGAPGVEALVALVIEVGGAQRAPPAELLLARLREAGWQGAPGALDEAPPALTGPPPRNLVSDQARADALDRILKAAELHLADPDLRAPERAALAARLAEIRTGKLDVRTRTERAWQLLETVERSLYARARETGEGG